MSKEAINAAIEALKASKHGNCDHAWADEAIAGLQALAEQPAPVQRKPTTYAERFTHAVAVLCGAQPPADMVAEWIENVEVNGEHRLQGWVLTQAATPFWAQGIVVLDAAHVLANDPEEGEGHEDAPQAQPSRTLTEWEFKAVRNKLCIQQNGESWDLALKDEINALLSARFVAHPSTPQPAPVQEPTKAMIDAAERIDWADADVRGNIVNMWQAMCAVAPQAQPAREPLTDEQREEIAKGWRGRNWTVGDIIDATEAAHGITKGGAQ